MCVTPLGIFPVLTSPAVHAGMLFCFLRRRFTWQRFKTSCDFQSFANSSNMKFDIQNAVSKM